MEISKFPQNVGSLTDSVRMFCNVDNLNFLEAPKNKRHTNRWIKRDAAYLSGRRGPSIPVPMCHPPKNVSSLEKAYQHSEMPWALRMIWSRFILNIKCNLLNNGSALLQRLCGEKSASVEPKKRTGFKKERNSERGERCSAWCCMVETQVRSGSGRGGCAAQRFHMKSK